MGPNRDGVWRESGLLERFPEGGPKVLWRVSIGGSYCGPAVADGRLYSRKSTFDDGLHTVMCTPVVRDGYIYGMCGQGELRCLKAETGERMWETMAVAGEKRGGFPNVFLVENQGRHLLWTDQGELILARLGPEGYRELSRAKLLEPVETTRSRDVLWCHPAFAHGRAYMHNGKELISVLLRNP